MSMHISCFSWFRFGEELERAGARAAGEVGGGGGAGRE